MLKEMSTGAITITVGSLFSWLPHITALFAFFWMAMRVYESWLNIKLKQRALQGCDDCEAARVIE